MHARHAVRLMKLRVLGQARKWRPLDATTSLPSTKSSPSPSTHPTPATQGGTRPHPHREAPRPRCGIFQEGVDRTDGVGEVDLHVLEALEKSRQRYTCRWCSKHALKVIPPPRHGRRGTLRRVPIPAHPGQGGIHRDKAGVVMDPPPPAPQSVTTVSFTHPSSASQVLRFLTQTFRDCGPPKRRPSRIRGECGGLRQA